MGNLDYSVIPDKKIKDLEEIMVCMRDSTIHYQARDIADYKIIDKELIILKTNGTLEHIVNAPFKITLKNQEKIES